MVKNTSEFVVRDPTLLGDVEQAATSIEALLTAMDNCAEKCNDYPQLAEAVQTCADFLQGYVALKHGVSIRQVADDTSDEERMELAGRRLGQLVESCDSNMVDRDDIHDVRNNIQIAVTGIHLYRQSSGLDCGG